MPFMALEIHGLQEIKIRGDLPHSENMISRYLIAILTNDIDTSINTTFEDRKVFLCIPLALT